MKPLNAPISSEIAEFSPSTTRDQLLAQCNEGADHIVHFEAWVRANPWLDQAKVELSMPWFPFICFEADSKPLVVFQLGEEGWKVGMSGEMRKLTQGITVAVASEKAFSPE